jgi:hypothetical protein
LLVELAEAAGVTPRWIRNRCASGNLEGAYKRANAWFIPEEVGQQWLEAELERRKAASSSEEEETAP